MRVNWGPEANQLLLLKLLETHNLQIDPEKIAAAWPKENGEGPSVRAIRDQFTRLRDAAWNQADIAASSPRTPRTPRHRNVGSSVPQTPKSTHTKAISTPFSSFAKRTREELEAEEEYMPNTPTPKRSMGSPRKVAKIMTAVQEQENTHGEQVDDAVFINDD